MEPPCKRRRIPRNDDPDVKFHERRARNDLRLKSAFESIFEKYGKDFSGIADEINLQTGEIVVDRGHVLGMRDETHPGYQEDLYDELNSDDEPEKLDRQGKADLLGLDPGNSLHESIVSASDLSCYSEDEPDSIMGDVDVQLSRIEADVNVGRVFCDGHRDHIFRPGPRPAENGVSKLSWKRRLQSRPPAVTSSHQRSLDPSFNDGQAIEPAWRAPPLPKPVASVQETGSVLPFSPHQREHERSASPPGASLWAPKASKRYSERRGGRQKKNSSTSRPKSPTKAQHPTVGKDLPVANVSSLNYEWSRISVCSRPEQIMEGPVPSTLPASPVVLEPPGIAAWTPGEDQLLRILKSARTPYSKMTMYFPERTETDLEDRWFDLHRLNSKLFSLQDVEPRTIDQRTTKSPNKDRQNRHNGSLPNSKTHVPDDDYSSADLRGAQERALPTIAKSDMCETRNLGSEQHLGKQQLKSRKPFNDFGQSTLATKAKSRKPTSELSDQVNSHRDVPSMSPFPENCNVLEEAPEATREKTVDNQWELRTQQDRPSDANVPEPRTESNKTSRLQQTNKETPRTAKSVTVPSSIPPLEDLSEDELSTSVQTVGTPARRPTKLTTTFSHAPRRHTLHV